MGFMTSIIVGILGFVIAFLIDLMPVETFLKFVPICWIPGFDCAKWYNSVKIYLIIFLIALIIWFIPFI